MTKYTVKRCEKQNELCQWFEIYLGTNYCGRILGTVGMSENDVVVEWRNQLETGI